MKEYILNFFVWYYQIFVLGFFRDHVTLRFSYLLNVTNALPNAKNFGKPLYQDSSSLGKFLGIIIRLWWIASGSVVSFIFIVPNVLIFIFLFSLPLILPLQIINFLRFQI
ncbi:MAG: hypothetical protein ABI721_04030 [Candidatus Dojkabacteria bacterium]